jgi:hypothetical protein
LESEDDEDSKEEKGDHRKKRRFNRRRFKHLDALNAIRRDYLGFPDSELTPLFGSEFQTMFRMGRRRFRHLMEEVMRRNISFYKNKIITEGKDVASLEAKLLLPLKTLAYGVPSHVFCDYFQMSFQFARECCGQFDSAIKLVYGGFIRFPSTTDLNRISKLHRCIHGVSGMLGSLDCTHTYWKNCPKAWQGSYKGKENKPSIVLEAMCDYHGFLWHVSYGYSGTLNDRTILDLSPLLERLIDGSFDAVETASGVVPFKVGKEFFDKSFILVDGIYPQYSRFVGGIKEPITENEKNYTSWQEGARKDIERAFGMLKGVWQFISRPIHLMNLEDIGKRVQTCLILHNVLVCDRVMEEVGDDYNPVAVYEEDGFEINQPDDLFEVQRHSGAQYNSQSIVNDNLEENQEHPTTVIELVTKRERWAGLNKKMDHNRLHDALMSVFGKL